MNRTDTFDWFSKFKSVVTSVDYVEHLGRLSTSKTDGNVARINEVARENGNITIHWLVSML